MEPTLRMISETVFPDDAEEIIRHSFQFMAALDPVDKKILSIKGNIPDAKTPSDLIREHFFAKYESFPEYNRFESNLIITYFFCLSRRSLPSMGNGLAADSHRGDDPSGHTPDPARFGRYKPDRSEFP